MYGRTETIYRREEEIIMRLAAVFSDNMVLQRNKKVCIFGESEKKQQLTVSIDNITVTSEVSSGPWEIFLPEHSAGGPYDMTICTDDMSQQIVFHNVMYGEVWLNNGQSNIEFELKNAEGGYEEIMTADCPEIRYYNVIKTGCITDEFLEEEKHTSWKTVTDKSFQDISAIGYYYARKLSSELGVAVGMIDCYQGGSSITCWLEKERLLATDGGRRVYNEYKSVTDSMTEKQNRDIQDEYDKTADDFNRKVEELKKEHPEMTQREIEVIAGDYPWPPPVTSVSIFRPCAMIETMLKRVAPYTIRGVVFYQGEQDTPENYNYYKETGKNTFYSEMLRALIEQYRELFRDKDTPFFMFQLPIYMEEGQEDMGDWAFLREAQAAVADDMTGVYLVSILDLGEFGNVHPVDKKSPGLRMAAHMLDKVYGIGEAEDMIPDEVVRDDKKIIISFFNTYGNIVILDTNIYGFEVITGEGKRISPHGYTDGDRIVLEVEDTVTEISYGFFNYGRVNVYNAKHLPLRQFRITGVSL